MKIIIAGGGIGGLTTALCCQHHGHQVVVLERAAELGEVGAGIQIPPNGMKVFDALGLDQAFEAHAFRPEAIEARMGRSGQSLFNIPLAETALERWGSPYLHIHRADYIALLANALQGKETAAVRLGQEVVGYRQTLNSVTVELADGSELTGDVLIGADGVHSAVRDQMLGADRPIFTGNVAWRAIVPIELLGVDAPRPTACAWMGRGAHCATYRVRRGEFANLVAVVERDDWTLESWSEEGSREDALADFAGWHPTITRILEEADRLYRWALFDRAPLRTWVEGRVALLGDAAHPMLPFMAQGAAMAVEDAWVLARELAASASVNEGLKAYEMARYDRASTVQARSRGNSKVFHRRTSLGQLATYGPMWLAGKIAPALIHKMSDQLYGYDVTAP